MFRSSNPTQRPLAGVVLTLAAAASACGVIPPPLTADTLDLRLVPFSGTDGETLISLTHTENVIPFFEGEVTVNGERLDVHQGNCPPPTRCRPPRARAPGQVLDPSEGNNLVSIEFASGETAIFGVRSCHLHPAIRARGRAAIFAR